MEFDLAQMAPIAVEYGTRIVGAVVLLFAKIGSLQSNPADPGLRGGLIQSAKAFTSNMNLLADRITQLRDSTFSQVDTLARYVARLREFD